MKILEVKAKHFDNGSHLVVQICFKDDDRSVKYVSCADVDGVAVHVVDTDDIAAFEDESDNYEDFTEFCCYDSESVYDFYDEIMEQANDDECKYAGLIERCIDLFSMIFEYNA